MSAQVAGSVIEIRADETQQVQAGAEIVRLDPADAEIALTQAEARLRERRAPAARALFERRAVRCAVVEQRRVALTSAREDLARRAPLAAEQVVSGEDVAHARRAVEDARAALEVALKQVAAARTGTAGVDAAHHPSVLAAKADYLGAWLAARRNTVVAPVSGYVAKRSVQVGQRVAPGTPLMSVVPLDQLWVDANFKEVRTARHARRPAGDACEADMYGSKVDFHGKVDGPGAPAPAAPFALLPAQNASGNWIKVVQRVPVRIALDPKELAEHPLRVGLSATRRHRHQPQGRRRAGGGGARAVPLCDDGPGPALAAGAGGDGCDRGEEPGELNRRALHYFSFM